MPLYPLFEVRQKMPKVQPESIRSQTHFLELLYEVFLLHGQEERKAIIYSHVCCSQKTNYLFELPPSKDIEKSLVDSDYWVGRNHTEFNYCGSDLELSLIVCMTFTSYGVCSRGYLSTT